ncbi:MAG TPA: LptE family protein [Bacteroidota bacterium]
MTRNTEEVKRKEVTAPQKPGELLLMLAPFLLILTMFSACTYSFKGGSVPAHLKTVAIPLVQDQSGYGDPALRDDLTQQLVDRFTNDNTLQIADRNSADSILEGVVTDVKDAPSVVQGGEQVAARRITVTVHVTFEDLKLRKKVWEKDFSNWGDYPSGGGLTQRNDGIKEAVRKLTEDILNDTVAGW